MNNNNNQSSQRSQIIRAMQGLMKELRTLAPHPDQPNHNGPLFVNCDVPMTAANDHNDGMVGMMILETMLGSAFLDAATEAFGSWTQDVADTVDISNALDCYSQYITDIEHKDEHKAAAHGKGSFARIAGKSISNSFNLRGSISAPLQAFYEDLPKRMKVENALAAYAMKLKRLDEQTQDYAYTAPSLAA